MYESPIEVIYNDIANQLQVKMENDICEAICSYNINVNRDELIKALNYDREQYKKGFEDARIQFERPQGEWLCNDKYLDCKCSICNSYALERGDYPELSPYCPQCGAKMEVKTNENND